MSPFLLIEISILHYQDRTKSESKCYPAIGTIARELKLSRSTVKRALADLEKSGRIRKVQRWCENGGKSSCILYSFLKFKFSKKGKYIIIKRDVSKDTTLETESCSVGEGGTTYIRVYFNNPFVLEPLSHYIYSVYKDCRKSALEYIRTSSYTRSQAEECIRLFKALCSSEVASLVMSAGNRKDDDASITEEKVKRAESVITRADVVINPIYSRASLNDICNLNNWDKGFEAGFPYWEQGESARKEGNLDEAIVLFDKARYNGYSAPALYDSYAKAYRQLKDYENEIVILEECIERKVSSDTGVFEARRNKVIKLLFAQQEVQRKAVEKEQKVLQKKKEEAASEIKRPKGRAIIQMMDDYTLVSEYESIAAAVNASGTSSKNIRDAANGVQKHAGGYRWRYKDQLDGADLKDTSSDEGDTAATVATMTTLNIL